MNYEEAVEWLYGTQFHGIKLGLGNMERLTRAMGIRTDSAGWPKFIHVAGTNGKGSTCAFLDSICRAVGFRTGLFTSPHLISFRERIRINGEWISEGAVAAILNEIRSAISGWEHTPTFFEITTALALTYFQREEVELVILETGMGGRLDATNIIKPLVAVITPIDLDHKEWLGETLAEIASEKAGIIKPGVPTVSAPQPYEAQLVISHLAHERDSAFHLVVSPINKLPINLPGQHQRWNAAVALHALEVAEIELNDEAVARGLRTADWPARYQRLNSRTVLDGAHNPSAARQLADTWRELEGAPRATLILGMLREKDLSGVCEALAPIAARVFTVPLENPRTCSENDLAEIMRMCGAGLPVIPCPDLQTALSLAEAEREPILITGSLFLAGQTLALLSRSRKYEVSTQ